MKPIRLALNARSLVSTHAGIASYTRNLALALQRSGAVDLSLFYGLSWSSRVRDTPVAGIDSLKVWVKRTIPRPYALMRFVQQRRFRAGIRGFNCDLYHEPSFLPFRFDGPTVITVHDLSPLRYPETHPPARVREVMERLPRAMETASAIIVDSVFIKDELIQLLNIDPRRVTSAYLGVGPEYAPRTAEQAAVALAAYGLAYRGYIFAVGTLEPRKNLIQAIDAYGELPEPVRKTIPLVIAGMKGWLSEQLEARIRQHEERGEVRWLGYVPAETLPMLYSGARMLVYPSFYEGFGLPVLEAMASGIPVITSKRASLPEVAGEAAIMVDPDDRDALREAMLRVIEDEKTAQHYAELGLAQAARFTWRDCAEKTLAVYRKVIAEQ